MIDKLLSRALACLLALTLAVAPAAANQSNAWSPTTGTVTGLQLTTNFNNAFSALLSSNSGSSAPANDQTSAAVKGQFWLNTNASPNTLEYYDGASWTTVANLDTSNHAWTASVASPIYSLASAGTVDLCGSTLLQAVNATITGTTGITSFGTSCVDGQIKILEFQGALALTNSGSLILPSGANITTAAGDTAIVQYTSGTGWRVILYQRASGASLIATANFTSTVSFNGVISPSALGADTNNWNPAGLSTANVIRFSCSSVYHITGITAPAVDGQVIVLDNIGSINCVLTSQDTNSTAGNRFAFDRPITVRPGRTVTVKYDATTARWVSWQEVPSQLVAGGFKNLRLLNVTNAFGDTAPGTPNNQYKIALDEIALEDANGGIARIDSSYSFSCTADVTGSTFNSSTGGLDTGMVAASTWYFAWVIFNPTTNVASCLLSISATAPTMPSGFTFKARVGANQTDGSSHFYRVQQYGRQAHYVNVAASNTLGPQVFASGNQTTCSASSPSLVAKQVTGNGFPAPTTATRVNVVINAANSGGGGTCILVAPSSAWNGTNNGPAGNNGLLWPFPIITTATVGGSVVTQWFTLESNSLYYGASNNAPNSAAISDWEDNL
jgi:hypothetical protein